LEGPDVLRWGAVVVGPTAVAAKNADLN